MEEILKMMMAEEAKMAAEQAKIVIDQIKMVVDLRNLHLATQKLEKKK